MCQNLEQGYFYLPGGHVEPGEIAAAAVKRELLEELSLGAHVGDCRLMAEQIFRQGGKARHEINLVFHVEHLWKPDAPPPDDDPDPAHDTETRITPGIEIRSAEPHIGFEWIAINNLPATDLRPAIVRDWLANHPESTGIQFISQTARDSQ
ncbi:MAG: NUDIX domain-containing protein [Phycisphaeraceae bacterium]|nr:NUDIX domain-containing protein [Phycisphaeraceae bacterium]